MASVTIIIPCYNEERHIVKCVESIIGCSYPKDRLEALFVDGGSRDRTRALLREFERNHPYIRVLDNPDRTPPFAMNIGVAQANGDYIIRMDAHSSFPADYVSRLIEWSQKLAAENVGATCITEVINRNPKSVGIKTVLGDPLGVGNSHFRTGTAKLRRVDTVPFGCFPRRVFEQYGLYDVRLARNQDIELNKRIIGGGGSIYLVPGVTCTYYARETLGGLWQNNFANGKWNVLTAFITGGIGSLSTRHFIPLVFVLSLLATLLVATVIPGALAGFLAIVIVYSLAIFTRAARITNSETNPIEIARAFATLHFAYGIGSLVGLLRLPGMEMDRRRSG